MELASRSGKPIAAHKANTSETSAPIARSHTASLSVSDEVVSAAFRQCGIHRVTDMRTAMDAIKACNLPPMRGNRLAVVSRSGGHAVVAADAASKYGFHLQPFPEAFLRMVESQRVQKLEEPRRAPVDTEKARAVLRAASARGSHQLRPEEALLVLSAYGIPVAPWATSESAAEAAALAAELGFPVAMKVMAEEIVHKSDVGGVLLNRLSAAEVETGFERLSSLAGGSLPASGRQSILVQKMVAEGLEIIVGGRQDPTFGPVLLLGLGGVFVEVLGDVALRVAPITPAEAWAMIDELRGSRLFKGVRGAAPADREALVAVITRMSQLLCDLPEIGEIDVNPVKVLSPGRGCVAVDCRIAVALGVRP